jgi:hypothetical protein
MPDDATDWTIVETDAAKPGPLNHDQQLRPSELETQFLGLCLRDEAAVKRWTEEGTPTLQRFDETRYGRLARAIHKAWTRDKVLLTLNTYHSILDGSAIPKLEFISEEVGYNTCHTSKGITADLAEIGRRIEQSEGTAEGRHQTLVDVMKAAKNAAIKVQQHAYAYSQHPGDVKHLDRAIDAMKSLKKIAEPKRELLIRQSGVANLGVTKPPVVIDGLIHRGQIANIVSSSKLRKSWLIHDLALCVTNGLTWLGRFKCEPAKVLVIDNELRTWELQERSATIANAKGKDLKSYDYVALKDTGLLTIGQLEEHLPTLQEYNVIILDALYRFYEEGHNENDNAMTTALYTRLDAIATKTGAAIIIVHHASKGDQSGKSTTDTGSGAGAQSRAADAHIALRPVIRKGQPQDDAPERATFTAAVRSFRPIPKLHLKWEFPFWTAVEPEEEESEDQLPTCEEFARAYARESWESRTTIENRARTDGDLTVRDAKGLFEAAHAEDHLTEKPVVAGKSRSKLYKLKNPVSAF